MKRLLLFSLLVLIISFGCNNITKKETRTITISNTSENMYCYPIESPLLGQSYLSERFLNTIAEIELQKTDLEEANTMKNKMFSVIAHDLRGPFGQLKMGLMLLEEGDLTAEERTEITAMLSRDHVNTSALLDNLLKWSIAQKGQMIYEPTTHAIQPLVAENISLFSKEATRKEVHLLNKVPDSLTAYFDQNMIQTVLRNLMSNAIKFTQVGDRITINGKRIGDFVSISVEDTGMGIPEDKVNKLFKKNKNFTTYGTDNEKGSGLGLELCYDLVVKNRGTIEVSSVEGEGTTIVFELPIDP